MVVPKFGPATDGMELYFYVLRAFAVLFFVLSLLAVPVLVIASAANDGLAIPWNAEVAWVANYT